MLNELEWPTLEDRREQASLAFCHKIHSGNVAIENNKYLTPAPRLRQIRASHELQYTRYLIYSDALKYSFPCTIPVWNALPAFVISVESTEESPLFRLQSQRYAFLYASDILFVNSFKLSSSTAHNHIIMIV